MFEMQPPLPPATGQGVTRGVLKGAVVGAKGKKGAAGGRPRPAQTEAAKGAGEQAAAAPAAVAGVSLPALAPVGVVGSRPGVDRRNKAGRGGGRLPSVTIPRKPLTREEMKRKTDIRTFGKACAEGRLEDARAFQGDVNRNDAWQTASGWGMSSGYNAAVENGHVEVMRMLVLEKGVNPDPKPKQQARGNYEPEIIGDLGEGGKCYEHLHPLSRAISQGQLGSVVEAVALGADPNRLCDFSHERTLGMFPAWVENALTPEMLHCVAKAGWEAGMEVDFAAPMPVRTRKYYWEDTQTRYDAQGGWLEERAAPGVLRSPLPGNNGEPWEDEEWDDLDDESCCCCGWGCKYVNRPAWR